MQLLTGSKADAYASPVLLLLIFFFFAPSFPSCAFQFFWDGVIKCTSSNYIMRSQRSILMHRMHESRVVWWLSALIPWEQKQRKRIDPEFCTGWHTSRDTYKRKNVMIERSGKRERCSFILWNHREEILLRIKVNVHTLSIQTVTSSGKARSGSLYRKCVQRKTETVSLSVGKRVRET